MSGNRKRTQNSTLWASVIITIVGLALVFGRNASMRTIVFMLGIALMLMGGVGVLQQISMRTKQGTSPMQLLIGVVLVSVGIAMLISPRFFNSLLKFVLGAVILVYSVWTLIGVIRQQKPLIAMVLPAVGIVVGILIMAMRYRADNMLLLFAGIGLAYTGIVGVINEVRG